jgi:hypothetical protein
MSERPYELVQTPTGTLARVRIRVHGRLRDAALADIAPAPQTDLIEHPTRNVTQV